MMNLCIYVIMIDYHGWYRESFSLWYCILRVDCWIRSRYVSYPKIGSRLIWGWHLRWCVCSLFSSQHCKRNIRLLYILNYQTKYLPKNQYKRYCQIYLFSQFFKRIFVGYHCIINLSMNTKKYLVITYVNHISSGFSSY